MGKHPPACADCGFLGKTLEVTASFGSPQVEIVTEFERASGLMRIGSPENEALAYPVCYMNRFFFPDVYQYTISHDDDQNLFETIEAEISAPRDCSDFVFGRPFRSPQWHEEDRRIRQLETQRQDTELRIAAMQDAQQQEMRAILRDIRDIGSATKELDDRSKLRDFLLGSAAVALATATLIFPEGVPHVSWRPHEDSTASRLAMPLSTVEPALVATPAIEPASVPTPQ